MSHWTHRAAGVVAAHGQERCAARDRRHHERGDRSGGARVAEAAECLGVSEDVVKTRLHRARLLLRQELFDRAGLVRQDAFAFHASRCDRVVAAVFARLKIPWPVH